MAVVEKIATTSKILMGTNVRELKLAALMVSGATSELAKRSAARNAQQMEEENLQLRGQVAELKLALAASKAVPVPSGKSKKGANGALGPPSASASSSAERRQKEKERERRTSDGDAVAAPAKTLLPHQKAGTGEGVTRSSSSWGESRGSRIVETQGGPNRGAPRVLYGPH